MIRILSLGASPQSFTWLHCLRDIESRNPGFLARADVIVGSSFGAHCALFLARHMAELPENGSAVELIDRCIAFMTELLTFNPTMETFTRLRVGDEAAYSNETMVRILTRPENLGADTTLGQMHKRVIIATLGTKSPPKVYDSRVDVKAIASEIALESSALPLILPLRNTLTNGAWAGGNHSISAISRVLADKTASSLDDIILFSLSGDPGTSDLANFPSPWDAVQELGSAPTLDTDGMTGDPQVYAQFQDDLDTLWRDASAVFDRLSDPSYAIPRYGVTFDVPLMAPGGSPNASWGWKLWLAYKYSPLFLYGVIVTNQQVRVAQQTALMLGNRAFRLAPSAFFSSGAILFAITLAEPPGPEAAHKAMKLTADLWANPETSEKYNFKPTVTQTQLFIDKVWLT